MTRPIAVAFDLGGTLTPRLADRLSSSLHIALLQHLDELAADRVYDACRAVERDYWANRADIGGHSLRHVVSRAFEASGVAADDQTTIADLVERRVASDFVQTPLVDGASEWIHHLATDVSLGLLSNLLLPAWGVEAWMQAHGLGALIRCVRVSSETGLRKPDPLAFLDLLACLGVPASRCVFVGNDVEEDVEGALTVGMLPVHVGVPRQGDWERRGVAWLQDFSNPPDPGKLLAR